RRVASARSQSRRAARCGLPGRANPPPQPAGAERSGRLPGSRDIARRASRTARTGAPAADQGWRTGAGGAADHPSGSPAARRPEQIAALIRASDASGVYPTRDRTEVLFHLRRVPAASLPAAQLSADERHRLGSGLAEMSGGNLSEERILALAAPADAVLQFT